MQRRIVAAVGGLSVLAVAAILYSSGGSKAPSEPTEARSPARASAPSGAAASAGQSLDQQMWQAREAFMERGDRAPARQFLSALSSQIEAGRGSFQLGILLREYTNFGMSDADLDEIFEPLARSRNPDHRALHGAWQNHVKLRTSPFEFSAPTMDGEPFDIARTRGKIVLVEHWNTACASCIEAMPKIHDLYRKYRPAGFEVVSVVYDYMGSLDRRRVRRIEKELGLTWTTLAAEGQWDALAETYGYAGAPQYMLLNRDGTLYAGTGAVDLGRNLEPLLKEMLAREASGST